jgi:hypothetical protein
MADVGFVDDINKLFEELKLDSKSVMMKVCETIQGKEASRSYSF